MKTPASAAESRRARRQLWQTVPATADSAGWGPLKCEGTPPSHHYHLERTVPTTIVVTGGREFTNSARLAEILDSVIESLDIEQDEVEIVLGDSSKGTDTLAREFCQARGYLHRIMMTEWDRLGKSAGYRMNETKARMAQVVVAFPAYGDPLPSNLVEIVEKSECTLFKVKPEEGDKAAAEVKAKVIEL